MGRLRALWPARGGRVVGVAGLLALAVSLADPAVSGASTANAGTVAVSGDGTVVYGGFNGLGFSAFSRDPSTGELTVLGEAAGTPGGGGLFQPAFAVTPDGANLYGVDSQSNQLVQYAAGGRGPVQQQTYPVLSDPTVAKDPITVAVSTDGSSLYVFTYGVQYGSGIGVTSDGKVTAFRRDPVTGNLTLVGTTALGSGNSAGEVGSDPVVSPDDKFLYVADTFGVGVLSRDTSTGAVTFVGDDGGLSSGGVNGSVAIASSPDGSFVYAAGPPSQTTSASSAISVLSRNATTGRLTSASEVQNGSNGVSGLSDIWGLTVSPDGRCLYATSRTEGSLAYFTRNSGTGALTFGGVLTEGSGGVTGLADARGVAVSADGKNVYVASANDNGVVVFSRNATTCAPSFLELAQDLFTLGQPGVNQGQATATLPVTTETSGTLELSVQPLGGPSEARAAADGPHATPVGPGVHALSVGLDPQEAKQLDTAHKLSVTATVTFTATGGTPTTKSTVIEFVKAAPSAAEIRAALFKVLMPSGKKARIAALLRNGGYLAHFSAPDAGSLTIRWYYAAKGAHLASAKARPVLLGSATVTFSTAGRGAVKISLTKAGRRLLKASNQLPLTGEAGFKLLDGQLVTVRRRFTIKR